MTSWKESVRLWPWGTAFGWLVELEYSRRVTRLCHCRLRRMINSAGTTPPIANPGLNSSAHLCAHIADAARPCRSGRVDRSITLKMFRLSSLTDGNDHIGFQNHEGTEAARTLGMNPNRDLRATCIIALALVALTLKLAIAYNTIGTNDAVVFYGFAKVLSQHSLEWTYQHSRYFNHPPLTAYYLRGIYALTEQRWCQDIGIHFPFLLRLPGIIADFLVVVVLLRISKIDIRIPTSALALLAVSPVSLMVSGFHGNSVPVMVLVLVCAVWFFLLTGLQAFSQLTSSELEPAQNIIITVLKMIIIGAALWIAWHNRHARGRAFVESLAYTWLVFFVFAPGVCPQYLIWLAPFILILSPMFYTGVLTASSIFLFAFYNITSGGLPWKVALATDDSKQHWTAWSLLPWLVITAGSIALWRKTVNRELDIRPFQLEKLPIETA